MKKIELEELKTLQMDVLSIIHSYCREHNIQYSLGCGSLLGAIRHKGYIPWDDDIDIYMLRDEYNKLINEFPEEYRNIRINSLERNHEWQKPYAKAYDVRTQCKAGTVLGEIGVNIDIFPIDSVPQKNSEWISFNKHRKFLHRLYESKYEPFRKERSLYRNIVLMTLKLLMLPFTGKQICLYYNKFIQKYNDSNSDYVFESCQGMLQKTRFPRRDMLSFIELPFEDRIFMGMERYDEYLCCGFGEYMKLPPEEKRVSHHRFLAWWK